MGKDAEMDETLDKITVEQDGISYLDVYKRQDRDSKLYEAMQPCLEKGMQLMAFSIGFSKEEIMIKNKLPIL